MAALEVLSQCCVHLKSLHLQGCQLPPRISLSALPALEVLNLSHCDASDELVVQFAALCPRLTDVVLVGLNHVSDESLGALLSGLPHLRHLQVTSCGVAAGDGLAAARRHAASPGLASLCVRGGYALSSPAAVGCLLALAHDVFCAASLVGLPSRLLTLDLSAVEAVTDEVIATYPAAFASVHNLVLCCTGITKVGVYVGVVWVGEWCVLRPTTWRGAGRGCLGLRL
jgi:hypothetical protein